MVLFMALILPQLKILVRGKLFVPILAFFSSQLPLLYHWDSELSFSKTPFDDHYDQMFTSKLAKKYNY